jgi:hypothetical protein
MENKDYIFIDDFIFDTFEDFGMTLEEAVESTDYLTLDEVKAEVIKRIKALHKFGYGIIPEQVAKYEIRDTQELIAGTQSIADNEYIFVISKYAARRKNEKMFDNIIYHEICHMMQLDYLFNNGFIFYINGRRAVDSERAEYVYSVLKVNGAHTPLWQLFANKVNRDLLIDPPVVARLGTKDVSDILLENTFNRDGLDIPDDCCFNYVPPELVKYIEEQQKLRNRRADKEL